MNVPNLLLARILTLGWLFPCLLISGGCGADPADDAFARTFIEHVRTQHPAGAAQLEPESEIASIGWEVVSRQRVHLPQVAPDSVVLREWTKLRDEQRRAQKLTYHVHALEQYSIVEIRIVGKAGRRYVNTVRMTGPIARHDTPSP